MRAMSESSAMNLRFPDAAQRETIAAAAKAEGVSMQAYILRAALDRATALERQFLEAVDASIARNAEAFAAAGPSPLDPTPEQRAAEQAARRNSDPRDQADAA